MTEQLPREKIISNLAAPNVKTGSKRLPLSTYRLQLNRELTFKDAEKLVPYLNDLGISDIYASPVLKTHPGSRHGYDITDFNKINPEIGTEKDFEGLANTLQRHGMGLILDIVPNHMRINDPANRWWRDVLENGKDSPYAKHFDIDWDAGDGQVILPILDQNLDELIRQKALAIEKDNQTWILRYRNLKLPLSPKTQRVTGFTNQNVEKILPLQAYRLTHWKRGNESINYRRFFDIDELAALCVERPEVFTHVHQYIVRFIEKGWVTGLRVDHVDGLYDPEQYFFDLAASFGDGIYIIAEKILTGGEKLPSQWPIEGTTGYDFANVLNGVFVECGRCDALCDFYRRFTGQQATASQVIDSSKMEILQNIMPAELHSLARILVNIAKQHPSTEQMTERSLRQSLQKVIASFPVYRTYIRANQGIIHDADRSYVSAAAHTKDPEIELLRSVLLMEPPPDLSEEQLALRKTFIMKFQQVTGPVMAKGVEDTALYRFFPLASLNDVGSHLGDFGCSLETFHYENRFRLNHWPSSMITTSTHDSKRSEDVRARIDVLSEIPQLWSQAVHHWHELNHFAEPVPDTNDEYLLYQTLVGTWPRECAGLPLDPSLLKKYTERIAQYMLKAVKEAKTHTSWISPDRTYENAVESFVRKLLNPDLSKRFIEDFLDFIPLILRCGMYNSLSQVLLKITCPGVPDMYQGCEIWNERLVDPDNRQAVDFSLRKKLLEEAIQSDPRSLLKSPQDGRIKLFITRQALKMRQKHPDLFTKGAYEAVEAIGDKARHVIAFARERNNTRVIPVAARFFTSLGKSDPIGKGLWGGTQIHVPKGAYRDALTGREHTSDGTLSLGDVLAHLPLALLESIA